MKLKHLTLISWCFFICRLSAQDSSSQKLNDEIGFDVTSFITLYSGLSAYPYEGYNYYSVGNYLLGYKHYFNHIILRTALSLDVDNRSERGGANSYTNYKSTGESFDIRAGIEHLVPLSPHWEMYYGLDILGGYGKSSSVDTEPDTSNLYARDEYATVNRIGAGPVLGVTFLINRRISLTTELSVYGLNAHSETRYDYYNNPPEEFQHDTRITDDFYMNIQYPLFVFFNIRL